MKLSVDEMINDSMLQMFTTHKLGSGSTRSVYQLRENKNRVMKVCDEINADANVIEWNIWCDFCKTKEGKRWLAKCYYTTDNRRVMIQEKLTVITDKNDPRLPKKIPRFLTDTKVTNWGVDKKGRVKCLDYGLVLVAQKNPWKLKKAKWWEL